MKTKFWINSLIILGIVTMFFSSCKKDDDEAITYSLTYNGNNNTVGSVPTQEINYEVGDTVIVLGNVRNLKKTECRFVNWNNSPDGSGTDYSPASTFIMGSANVTLYAKWIMAGKLTVKISDAISFNEHSIYYKIYDSNELDQNGFPSGNILGKAKLDIINNCGSVITIVTSSDSIEKIFDNGTYYLSGMVDMNDNAESTGYFPDSGDMCSNLITVEISGDSEFVLTENNFPYSI